MFVNLLTGCGRSPIYQALSFVFDSISAATGHAVVVVSPIVMQGVYEQGNVGSKTSKG